MATNERPFSEPTWGGQEPGPHGTGFHENLAGQGKHGQRAIQATRWAQRRPPALPAIPDVHGPVVVPERGDAFVQGFLAAERAGQPRNSTLARAAVGGLIGYAVGSYLYRRSR